MPDIFDTLEAAPQEDIFDRVAAEGDIFDQVAPDPPPSPAPATAKAAAETPKTFSFLPQSAAQIESADYKEIAGKPLVELPRIEYDPNDTQRQHFEKAAGNVLRGFVSGATTPEGFAGVVFPPYGLAQIASALPEVWDHVKESEKTPPGSPERWEAGLQMVAAVGGLGGGAKAMTLRPAAKTPSVVAETVVSETARVVPTVEVTPKLLRGEAQGDLISSTQVEPFALKAEKAVDYELRQKQTALAGKEAEAARLKTEKEQLPLLESEEGARRAEAEYRAELEEGAREYQERGGQEFYDALEEVGGLPAISSPRQHYAGELKMIREEYKSPTRKDRIRYAKIFKSDAPDLDVAAQAMKAKGFNIDTPDDLLVMARERGRTGKPIYGMEAIGVEGFGPGAASAKETLASYELRKFGERFGEDARIAEEVRTATGNRFYEPIPNKLTAEQARQMVEERGVGQSINIVKDEANPLPPHVRSAMGQLVIQKLNKSYRALKEQAPQEAQNVLNQAVEMAEWQMEYGTRLGQGVQSFAMWARLTPEGKLLTVRRGIQKARERVQRTKPDTPETDLPNLTPEAEKTILELGQKVEDAAEGMPKDKAVLELNRFIAQQKGFDVSDLPLGIYYGNILSGYNTHLVNSLDTFLNVVSEVNGLAITNPRAAAKIYGGMIRGLNEGKLDALLSLSEGRMVTDGKWMEVPRLMEVADFGTKGGVPIKPTSALGKLGKRIVESKPAKILNAYKYVTRLLSASDAVMFRGAKEARGELLAYRMAESEGLKGDQLFARQKQILSNQSMADFEAAAKREGFNGVEAKVRAAELREQARPEELSAESADFAGEATYNHRPHGVLGYFATKVAEASERVKPLKLFVPFTRIVANVTNRGLNWTPYGFKRAKFGYFGGEMLTPEARTLMLTRATLGTTGLVTLGAMQAVNALQIHGAGPADLKRRKQLQAAGWKPYSVQMGDNYFSYIYTPVGLGLSIVGNMSDASRYSELDQKDAATRGAYAISRVGSTVFSQSFLSGLSRLFDSLSASPQKAITGVKQTLSSTVGAFTTPNIVRDVQRWFDPKAYKSNTLMEDLVRNTPFAGLALNPDLNAFGEPVRLQRQRFVGKLTSDPQWRTVIELGLQVPVPSKTTEIKKGQQITPQQYYDLLKGTGPLIKKWVKDNESQLRKLTTDQAQDSLTQASIRIRKYYLNGMRSRR